MKKIKFSLNCDIVLLWCELLDVHVYSLPLSFSQDLQQITFNNYIR